MSLTLLLLHEHVVLLAGVMTAGLGITLSRGNLLQQYAVLQRS